MVLIGDNNFLQRVQKIGKTHTHNLKIVADSRQGGGWIIFHYLPSNQCFAITFTVEIMCQNATT